MELNRRYTDIISTDLSDEDRLAIDQHNLAMKSRQTKTPVDSLTLGERSTETDEHRELLRAGAKTRLLELAGIGEEDQQGKSTDSPQETEHPLTPEQAERMIQRLETRSEAEKNKNLCPNLDWSRAKSALTPEVLWTVNEAEQNGHEPTIYFSDGTGFDIGTRTDETPQSTRNCVYDEKAAEPLRKQFPDLRSAVKSAEDMGFDGPMTVDQGKHIAENTKPYFEPGWSYYETPEDIRKAGIAFGGARDGFRLDVFQCNANEHNIYRGWRGTLRVNYVD